MKKMSLYIIVASCILFILIHSSNTKAYDDFLSVSIYSLISNPTKFHNKNVEVTGFLNIEQEGNALYAHKNDFDQAILKNSVWLNIERDNLPGFSQVYVSVRGKFDAKNNGHFGLFSSSISNIQSISINRSRAELLEELENKQK